MGSLRVLLLSLRCEAIRAWEVGGGEWGEKVCGVECGGVELVGRRQAAAVDAPTETAAVGVVELIFQR